jgi:heptosyltransferase I
MDPSPRSIAVLRLSALGDVVMTVPLLHTLHRAFPQTPLFWIVSRPFDSVIAGLPGVQLIVVEKPRGPLSFCRLLRQMRGYEFDWLLVPQASMRANLVTAVTRANRKIGFGALHSRDLQRWFVRELVPALPEHQVESFLRFASYVGVKDLVREWNMPLAPEDVAWARAQLAPLTGIKLAVVLAASKAERNWPVPRYRETLERLAARWPLGIVLCGGPSALERRLADELCRGLRLPLLDLVGRTSPRQLVALVGEADALFAPDTGVVHVARAMDTPVVCMYGVAPSAKSGPYGALEWTLDVYAEAAAAIMGRGPERLGWRLRVHHERAVRLIQVDAAVQMLERLFAHLGFKPQAQAPRRDSPARTPGR